MLNRGFWERAIKEDATWDTIKLSVASLIGADFAAGAILISFGAMLGRVTASQLLVMATLEVIVYSINEMILVERFHVADIGGSMIIRAEHRGPGREGERAVPPLVPGGHGPRPQPTTVLRARPFEAAPHAPRSHHGDPVCLVPHGTVGSP
jgi:hypothetical protein